LLGGDFAREGTIGLVEDVLAADFDGGVEVFADEAEEEAGWGDDDFCFLEERIWSVSELKASFLWMMVWGYSWA